MSLIKVRHDLRGRLGPARDQGVRETCLAFATSDAHAAAIGNPFVALCCEYLFYHAKQLDGTPAHQGTTFRAIRTALKDEGQPVESDWPYLDTLPADLTKWKPPATITTLYRRKTKASAKAFNEIWTAIEGGSPAVVGMTLSNGFYVPNKDGVVDANEPADPAVKHAVLAIATGTAGKKKLVLARNSWGSTWGLSGCAWLSERYMTPRIKTAITMQ